MKAKLLGLVGLIVLVIDGRDPRRRERGLSQSTENAILLAGAVTIATVVIVFITAYIKKKLAAIP